MSSDPMIEVRGLGKSYEIAASASPTRLTERLTMGRGSRSAKEVVWALRDVDLHVTRGEVIGLVGRNGAGKSTFLKILSRVTAPTEGRVTLRGRIGSLLEVGTGFHPELTGRENAFMNGALLGMTRREVAAELDSIVDFAGVEQYIDVPVKRYSSGMYTRLAFAVAAHLDTEILLVDEVLAVGDAQFQQRSLGRMQEAAGSGRTVVFVSHSMNMIGQLCSRCVWFDHGAVRAVGSAKEVISSYLQSGRADSSLSTFEEVADLAVQYLRVEIGHEGERRSTFSQNEPVDLTAELLVKRPVPGLYLTMVLRSVTGQIVFVSDSRDVEPVPPLAPGLHELRVRIPGGLLNSDSYAITMGAASPYDGNLDRREAACEFEVHDIDGARSDRPGTLGLRLPWKPAGSREDYS